MITSTIHESSAALLAHPLRRQILEAWDSAASAADVAEKIGVARQKVNYHARALADHGFLERAGRRKKRNMWEQRYVRSEKFFVLSPEILGPLAPSPDTMMDRASAGYAIALASRTQSEVARLSSGAAATGKRLATLSLDTEIEFANAADRAAFATELEREIERLIAEYSSPDKPRARPFRLAMSIYPKPKTEEEAPK